MSTRSSSSRPSAEGKLPTKRYSYMALSSMVALRKQKVSVPSISAYMSANFLDGADVHAPSLRKALAAAADKGLVERVQNSFRVTAEGRSACKPKKPAKGKRTAATGRAAKTKTKSKSKKTAAPQRKRRSAVLPFGAQVKATAKIYDEQAKKRAAALSSCLRALFKQYPNVTLKLWPEPKLRFECKRADKDSEDTESEAEDEAAPKGLDRLLAQFLEVHRAALLERLDGEPASFWAKRGGFESSQDEGSKSDGDDKDAKDAPVEVKQQDAPALAPVPAMAAPAPDAVVVVPPVAEAVVPAPAVAPTMPTPPAATVDEGGIPTVPTV